MPSGFAVFLIEPAADKTSFWYTGTRLHSRDFNFIVVDRTIRIVIFPVGIETDNLLAWTSQLTIGSNWPAYVTNRRHK